MSVGRGRKCLEFPVHSQEGTSEIQKQAGHVSVSFTRREMTTGRCQNMWTRRKRDSPEEGGELLDTSFAA